MLYLLMCDNNIVHETDDDEEILSKYNELVLMKPDSDISVLSQMYRDKVDSGMEKHDRHKLAIRHAGAAAI